MNLARRLAPILHMPQSEDIQIPIVNPIAATGDTTGWTSEVGTLGVYYDSPMPPTGRFFFYGCSSQLVVASQEINVSEYASILDSNCEAHLTWLQASYSSGEDTSTCGLRFLDSSKALISESAEPEIRPEPRMTWIERSHIVNVPIGTRYITIFMRMNRQSGTDNDGYTVDFKLSIKK